MFMEDKKLYRDDRRVHWRTRRKTANTRYITCQRNEPYVLVHLKPGNWINTPHPNLACGMSTPTDA